MRTVNVVTRRLDLDFARSCAIAGVVAVHASAGTVLRGAGGPVDASFAVALLFDSVGRVAVPVFFAIAGWVLLAGRPVASPADLTRRVIRVMTALAVWTLVYAAWVPIWEKTGDFGSSPSTIAGGVAGIPASPQLWYLYAYIPLLLLLGTVTLAFRRVAAWGSAAALVVLATMPVIVRGFAGVTGLDLPTSQWVLPLYAIGFAVAGGLFLEFGPVLDRRGRLIALMLLCVLTAGMAVLAALVGHALVFSYAGPFVAAQCLLALAAVNRVRVPDRLAKPVRSLADASFGVFLVHMLVLQGLLLVLARVGPMIGGAKGWWSIPVLTLLTLAISWGLSSAWGRAGWRRVLG